MKPISYNILVMCRTTLFDNNLLALMNVDASLLWLLIHLHTIQGVPGIIGACCLVDGRSCGDACSRHISRYILDLIVAFIVLLIQYRYRNSTDRRFYGYQQGYLPGGSE